MKRIMTLALAAVLTVPMAAAAQTQIIDSYTTNQATLNGVVGGVTSNVAAGEALGGNRQLYAEIPTAGQGLTVTVTGGEFVVATDNTASNKITAVRYGSLGGFADFTGGLEDFSPYNTFVIDLVSLDFATSMVISVEDSTNTVFSTGAIALPPGTASPGIVFSTSFGALAGAPNFSNITGVSLTFTTPNANTDLVIDNFRMTFTAVPEPTTFALLGLMGAGAFGYRRHQKRKNAELEAKVAEKFAS